MPQSLTSFIHTIGNYGVARNNKFEVILPRIVGANNENKISSDDLWIPLYAETLDIPGKLINTVPTRIQSKTYELPSEFLYSDTLNLTFLVDTRMQVRHYFDAWLNIVMPNGYGTSFSPNMPSMYKCDAMKVNVIDFSF